MINFMVETFGSYEPLIFIDDDGVSHAITGAAGVDWTYICSVFIFCVFVVCIFKLIGRLLNR